MFRTLIVLSFITFVFCGCSDKKAEAPQKQEIILVKDGSKPVKTTVPHAVKLLEEHCCRCHNEDKKKGKIDLGSYLSNRAPLSNVGLWKEALIQLETGIMPPEGKRQPTVEDRKIMSSWLSQTIKKTYMTLPDDPGKTVIRRLNRQEYIETMKDLLGIDGEFEVDLPVDNVGYGFDNIAELMSVPPLMMEKYMAAARHGLDQAVIDNTKPRQKTILEPESFSINGNSGRAYVDSLTLWANGDARANFKVEHSGEYEITLTVAGDQAGKNPVEAVVRVGTNFEKKIYIKNIKYSPADIKFKVQIPSGTNLFSVSFINDYYDQIAKKDRNFHMTRAVIDGPLNEISLPDSHKRLIALKESSSVSEDHAALENIKRFLNRAFRSEVGKDQIEKYFKLFKKTRRNDRSFEYSLKIAYLAALVSPQFLFRIEQKPKKVSKVSDYELAARLSYFLHSSMPDEKLLASASAGKLSDKQLFRNEVSRLLKSPNIATFSENFAGQWLQLRSLDRLEPDTKLFPKWNEKLKDSMKQESIELFNEILSRNLPLEKFITHNRIHINETLADHYNLSGIKGDHFRPVNAPAGRGGILTQASVLTVTSMPARTSPVKRGKWIMEEVLGSPPPPPPQDVSSLEETAKINPGLSLKEKLELHRQDDMCASCHIMMDAIGFSFENFDAIGQWRSEIDGKPVDATGTLPDGTELRNTDHLRAFVVSKKEKFVEHMISKVLVYALGRGLESSDYKTVYQIMDRTRAQNYRFMDVIVAVTESIPFQYKKP